MKGTGLPSTPKDNVKGSPEAGDTLAAVRSGFDVYVISGNGLALAPASSKNPTTGSVGTSIAQHVSYRKWHFDRYFDRFSGHGNAEQSHVICPSPTS
jgi:hypothetical protein